MDRESLNTLRSLIQTIQIYFNGIEFKLHNEIQALGVSRSTLARALDIVEDFIRKTDEGPTPESPAPTSPKRREKSSKKP